MTPEFEGPIVPSSNVKDLGIYLDNNLSYRTNINEISKKVKKRVGWILRAFKSREKDFIRFVWKTYVLPLWITAAKSGLLGMEDYF